jgi:hypothetical protein
VVIHSKCSIRVLQSEMHLGSWPMKFGPSSVKWWGKVHETC